MDTYVVYAIKWAHEFCGVEDPCKNSFPRTIIDGAKRSLKPRKNFKDYVSVHILINICHKLGKTGVLRDSRFCAMAVLAFAGFMRISEILNLRRKDLVFYRDYLTITIRSSKTDKFNSGKTVFISAGESVACPRKVLLNYLGLSGLIDCDSDHAVFRSLKLVQGHYVLNPGNKFLHYSVARKELLFYLKELGYI